MPPQLSLRLGANSPSSHSFLSSFPFPFLFLSTLFDRTERTWEQRNKKNRRRKSFAVLFSCLWSILSAGKKRVLKSGSLCIPMYTFSWGCCYSVPHFFFYVFLMRDHSTAIPHMLFQLFLIFVVMQCWGLSLWPQICKSWTLPVSHVPSPMLLFLMVTQTGNVRVTMNHINKNSQILVLFWQYMRASW